MKITLGFVALADHVSETDAVAVQSLREAGAIVYCKTTMPQTGMVRFFLFGAVVGVYCWRQVLIGMRFVPVY